jgi:AcrR family transcriptional regulator
MSDATRRKLMDAALETLVKKGIKGTTARAIAATAAVNQALIFYHFGGVMELLITAALEDSKARVEAYRERLEGVVELNQLVEVAQELRGDEGQDGGMAVFTQLLAATAGDPEQAPRLWEGFEPWVEVVASALRKPLETTGFDQLVSVDDLAYSVVGLFMGVELMTRLNPERSPSDALFATFTQLSGLLGGTTAPSPG